MRSGGDARVMIGAYMPVGEEDLNLTPLRTRPEPCAFHSANSGVAPVATAKGPAIAQPWG
jgi:hypothetical protein